MSWRIVRTVSVYATQPLDVLKTRMQGTEIYLFELVVLRRVPQTPLAVCKV